MIGKDLVVQSGDVLSCRIGLGEVDCSGVRLGLELIGIVLSSFLR